MSNAVDTIRNMPHNELDPRCGYFSEGYTPMLLTRIVLNICCNTCRSFAVNSGMFTEAT